jgi:hypothetical protein
MRDIPRLSHDFLPGGCVIAFIQRQMLGAILSGAWPGHDDGFESLAEQLIIIYIGRFQYDA